MTVFAGQLTIAADRLARGGRGRAIMFMCGAAAQAGEINCMATHARGVVSLAVTPAQAMRLGLQPMAGAPVPVDRPQYLVSIEAACCSETGISAAERALTIRVASALAACPGDVVSPGHIMPLLVPTCGYRASGLAEIALAEVIRATGIEAAAWCDILDDAGEVASFESAWRLSAQLQLPFLDVTRGQFASDPALTDWSMAA